MTRGAVRRGAAAPILVLALAGTAACGGDGTGTTPTSSTSQSAPQLASAEAGDLRLSAGWVAATLPHADSESGEGPMTAGYGRIENVGSRADRLVGASSDAAGSVQIHRTTTDEDGSAGSMVRTDAVQVPAHGSARLRPGGYHLMVMGLKDELDAGSSIDIDLRFASGTEMSVHFPVIDRADRPRSGGGSHE